MKGVDFNIKAAVRGALRGLDLEAKMKGYAVWSVWEQAVGGTIASHAQPAFMRGGVLFVTCASSAWIQQLQFMKGDICAELNRRIGKGVIKDIKFQMGVIDRPPRGEAPDKIKEEYPDEAQKARIEEVLKPLKDHEIKEIVRRIMLKEAKARRLHFCG